MPTQIPVEAERSWMAAAKVAAMLSLLAATIVFVTAFVIVWVYT
jgi:hypothetical protein